MTVVGSLDAATPSASRARADTRTGAPAAAPVTLTSVPLSARDGVGASAAGAAPDSGHHGLGFHATSSSEAASATGATDGVVAAMKTGW